MSDKPTIRVLGAGGDYEDWPNPNFKAHSELSETPCSASPSALEYCCVQILKGKFWCDVGHDLQVIYEILEKKKLMKYNSHGHMVEVTPNDGLEPSAR